MLLQDGGLYGCGDNSQGQLGTEGEFWVGWRALEGKFQDVTCGWEFTAVINPKDELMTRGCGPKGELGVPGAKKLKDFAKVTDVRPGSKLFSSLRNCVVVEPMPNGSRVLGWGSNTKCQLREPKCRVVDHPVVVFQSETRTVDYVAMGKDFMVFVDTRGLLLHTTGILPVGFSLHTWRDKPVQVSCMWSSLHVWPGPGFPISSCGNGNHGQLFTAPQHTPIEAFTTGSEHGIAVTAGGDVSCWGWGEHGNCGRIETSDTLNDYSNHTSPLNKVFTVASGSRTRVYGGSASTWIVTE